MTETWLNVLGPFRICRNGAAVPVPAAKHRAVLAVLGVRAGQVVSFDELADIVWDGVPPAGARATLRGYVKRLRQTLGPELAGRVVTRGPGYLLEASVPEVDVLLFDRLCAQGGAAVQAGAWSRAVHLLGDALALWRGEPLVDIGCQSLRRDLLPRLVSQRLQATEGRIDAGLALGQHAQLVTELTELADAHPLRERFCAQLMLALYRCGRQAEALAAYQRTRRVLVEDLGVEPDSELRDLQRRILAADPGLRAPAPHTGASDDRSARTATPAPPAGVLPRQLPAAVSGFAGRAAELAALDRLADDSAGAAGAVAIVAIGGTAGVGKTALATHWAHRVAHRFPDGQLYANLRGFDPGGQAVAPVDAIRGFLDALGMPPGRVPQSLDAQAAHYRSLLAGKRVLVVLDNARDAEQVRPLLPGTSAAFVIVTSRNRLAGLVAAEAAHPLTLDLLTEDEARQLLAHRLGADRVAAEADAVDEIIARCARLPLALTIAAARAATRAELPLAEVAAELVKDGRLDALSAGDAVTHVRAVFSWSYAALTPGTARLFRLLGLHPGPDVSAAAAASLAASRPAAVRPLLDELTGASLLAEHAPGRYSFHDLLRAYAADLAQTVDGAAARRAAVGRLLDHYLHTGHGAAVVLNPARDPIDPPLKPPAPGVGPERLANHGSAMAWFAAEQPILLGAVQQAAQAGFDLHCWQLAWTMDTFLFRQGHWLDVTASWQHAARAARGLPHPATLAYAHRRLARAATQLGRHRDADAHLCCALDLYLQAGDELGQAHTHHDLARVHGMQGRPERSLEHARQALAAYRAVGHRHGQATALNLIGWDHALLGDHGLALDRCEPALGLLQELGDRSGEADTWDTLGYAHHHLGHHEQAADCYRHAAELFADLGDRYEQAATLSRLGQTQRAAGDPEAARATWRRAEAILTDLEHPAADEVRGNLRALDRDREPAPERRGLPSPPAAPTGSAAEAARPAAGSI